MGQSGTRGQICCTGKLLSELGLKPGALPYPETDVDPLSVWYAHLFREQRRKCLIVMNPATGYMGFGLYIKRDFLRAFPSRLSHFLANSLYAEGFSVDACERVRLAVGEPRICRTNDRKTLAHINQVLKSAPYTFDHFYRAERIPTDMEFARWFNHSLYGPHWGPAKAIAKLLGENLPPESPQDRLWEALKPDTSA